MFDSISPSTAGSSARAPIASATSQRADRSSAHVFDLLQQLAQSLTVLGSVADLMLERQVKGTNMQSLRIWLQTHARQIEGCMHKLRELHLACAQSATDLTQSLTVMVLASDILTQGQLSGDDTHDSYRLLRRNAERAMGSLREMRAQVAASLSANQV